MQETLADFLLDERGQSLTEYGAIIAFVGVLIALIFHFASGGIMGAVSQSYSSTSSSLGALNAAVNPP